MRMAAAQTVKPAAPALRKICDILAALAELPVGPGIIPGISVPLGPIAALPV
jgi:hypothetical protein